MQTAIRNESVSWKKKVERIAPMVSCATAAAIEADAATTRTDSRCGMAGGGIRGGKVIGATDEIGFKAYRGPGPHQ